MKIRFCKLISLTLAAITLALTTPAFADYGRGPQSRGTGQNRSSFWDQGSSESRYPATAEISQALYGTPPEPYDTPADNEPAEITQAG